MYSSERSLEYSFAANTARADTDGQGQAKADTVWQRRAQAGKSWRRIGAYWRILALAWRLLAHPGAIWRFAAQKAGRKGARPTPARARPRPPAPARAFGAAASPKSSGRHRIRGWAAPEKGLLKILIKIRDRKSIYLSIQNPHCSQGHKNGQF